MTGLSFWRKTGVDAHVTTVWLKSNSVFSPDLRGKAPRGAHRQFLWGLKRDLIFPFVHLYFLKRKKLHGPIFLKKGRWFWFFQTFSILLSQAQRSPGCPRVSPHQPISIKFSQPGSLLKIKITRLSEEHKCWGKVQAVMMGPIKPKINLNLEQENKKIFWKCLTWT